MVSDAVYEHALAERDAALQNVRDEAEQTCIEIDLRKAAEARVAVLEQALRELAVELENDSGDEWIEGLAVTARAALGDPS